MNYIEQTLTSMEVAEMVDKEHKELLRDIRRYCSQLGESKIALTDFFTESTYKTEQNKEMPCYKVTKKGCEFISHKLTGVKGSAFTARYIDRFHEMEQIIQNPVIEMSVEEKIALLAQGNQEIMQKIENVKHDLDDFKQDLPLLGVECQKITRAKNQKVVPLLGGKNAPAYKDKSLRSKVYSDIQREICRQFGVSSYKEIKRCQTDKALDIIKTYQLPFALEQEVQDSNAQYSFA